MSARTLLRASIRPHRAATLLRSSQSFFSLPSSSSQHLSAARTLPYARSLLYDLIADVDSYSSFVPYCSLSRVTQWSEPDSENRRHPTRADLHVGWGGLNEVFTSRLHCVPGVSVEATSGVEVVEQDGLPASAVFQSLVTKWTLSDLARGNNTEVQLDIKYQFLNPLYAAVSAAVSDKIASTMIEAFEERAKHMLNRQQR